MAPKRLSREAVVRAALELLNQVGIDGLTVRALAHRLGVRAPTLYWHVSNKQDLLDEMATHVWREVADELDAIDENLAWRQSLRAFAEITRRKFLAYRDGAKVFSGTYVTDSALLERQEAGLARMLAQGFSLANAIRAYSLLYSFTVGFCIEEQSVQQVAATGDSRYSIESRNARLDERTHPLVVASGPEIFGDADARFADLVGVIIDAVGAFRSDTLR